MRPKADVVDVYSSLGLSVGLSGFGDAPPTSPRESESTLPTPTILAQVQELSAEVNRLRVERERWQVLQAEIINLLGSKSPERILHDLRNVLNERELYRSLADLDE